MKLYAGIHNLLQLHLYQLTCENFLEKMTSCYYAINIKTIWFNNLSKFQFIINSNVNILHFFCGATALFVPRPSHCRGFKITLKHTIVARTPVDECSAFRRGLYLTVHSTRKRQTSMPPAVFEPAVPASEGPQTYVLEGAAIGIGAFIK
jgi:hypothetical protein